MAATQTDQTGERPRLLLLDGHSLAYRAFFALPVESFSTTTGQPTNAVYGFTAMLINVLRDEKPTHVAVAFDLPQPTFRHEAFADYKANRAETPADFRGQVSLVKEVLAALRVPQVSAPGFEADDVIATVAISDPADLVISAERIRDLQTHFDQVLSDLEAEVLRLYVAGKSYQEIAERLQRHVKSIDNALQRIKRKLEGHLNARSVADAG